MRFRHRFAELRAVGLRRAIGAALTCLGMLCATSERAQAVTVNIFGDTIPASVDGGPDGQEYELGTFFTSSAAGDVLGFRFYAGPLTVTEALGPFTGKLWLEGDQSLLTSIDFPAVVEGWNEVLLPTPFPILGNTSYVVSVNTSGQRYPFDSKAGAGYFPAGSAPITGTRSGIGFAGPGAFPGEGPFPGGTTGSSYFRDVIFETDFIVGDVNGDLVVNIGDFDIIRQNFFVTPATLDEGDLNLDGLVDFDDFRIWKDAFGGGGPASVPEPATAGLLAVGLGMLCWRNRHRFIVR